jgi:hypothetical protein
MAKNTTLKPPVKPAAHVLARDVDFSVLSEERKAELREKAEAKVRAQQILEAEDAYLAKQMDDLDKELHPETVYEMRDLRLDLALYADRVTLDGKAYYHGELYTVPKPVYDVLKECEARTWRHDDEIRSGDTNDAFYRKSRQMSVNMRTGATTAAGAPLRF